MLFPVNEIKKLLFNFFIFPLQFLLAFSEFEAASYNIFHIFLLPDVIYKHSIYLLLQMLKFLKRIACNFDSIKNICIFVFHYRE